MKYDDLFQYIGQIGVYQTLIAVLCFMFSVFGVESIALIFIAAGQEHWCHVPELEVFSHEQQRYIAIPQDEGGEYVSCDKFDLNYSMYSVEEFVVWDREVMVGEDTDTTHCNSWVWDQSLFASTATKRVITYYSQSYLFEFSMWYTKVIYSDLEYYAIYMDVSAWYLRVATNHEINPYGIGLFIRTFDSSGVN